MKIVINQRHSGFRLSQRALEYLYENGYDGDDFKTDMDFSCDGLYISPDGKFILNEYVDIERNHPLLIKCVEELGKKASEKGSDLNIIEIPDEVDWEIQEYDGWETIHEKHRSWG